MNAETAIKLDEAELDTLRESIAGVLSSECDSRAVHAWLDRSNDLGAAIWKQAADLGWLGLALPESAGGMGLGARGLSLLFRETGAHVAPGGFIATLCAAQWLAWHQSDAKLAALASSIAGGETDIAVPALIGEAAPLELNVDGNAVSGKITILSGIAGVTSSNLALVPVTAAWALVHVDGTAAKFEPIEGWDLTRCLCELTCSAAPAKTLIPDPDGKAGELLGTLIAMALAADSLGAARGLAGKTVEYLKERVQFDRPVASFQALRHRVADLYVRIATQDSLLEQAVQCLDNGSPDAAMWSRLAKAGASDAAVFVATECILLHGGVGHTWEYDPHIYMKRARLNEALLGSNRALRDTAVDLLDRALDEGRTTTELNA